MRVRLQQRSVAIQGEMSVDPAQRSHAFFEQILVVYLVPLPRNAGRSNNLRLYSGYWEFSTTSAVYHPLFDRCSDGRRLDPGLQIQALQLAGNLHITCILSAY